MVKRSIGHPLVLGLTLLGGVGWSVAASLFVNHGQVSSQQARFQRQVDHLTTALQRSLNRYTDVLAFLGDYYRVSHGHVSRTDFDQFAARSLQRYPGIQALEWAPLVSRGDRATFEQRVRDGGYPHFRITELGPEGFLVDAAERPYYIPVTYVAPFQNNEAALGFDLNSDPIRTAAITTARDQGIITATSPIHLVQESQNQYGFLVFLPLYPSSAIPSDLAGRRQQFEGVLLGVFRVSDVVEEALQDLRYDIDFVLYDQGPSALAVVGRYDSAQNRVNTAVSDPTQTHRKRRWSADPVLCPTPEMCTHTLSVGNRQWQVRFSPAPTYAMTMAAYGAPLTLIVGLLVTASLISFLYNLNRELVGAKRLNQLKFRFFSMASHELRTPLSTILLSAESLQLHQQDWSEAQKHSNIQRICVTAKRMGQQIADMLTLARSEVGKLEFHPHLLEVEALCRQVITELEADAPSRVTLVGPDKPITAFWDQALARSLLTNLIANALKYSPSDSPVTVTVAVQDAAIVIRVSDQGRGIPSEEHQAVREAFTRGSNVSDIPGTGLGLAVVNTCVAIHQGQWVIVSPPGEGTTVTVTLPLD